MRNSSPKNVLLIAGATASGKSALALAMARARNGVIINADSMQVYRELRILSARPTAEDEGLAQHRLYGHMTGAMPYSVAQWLQDAAHEIESCWVSGKLPIICGGTGLYFKALEEGLSAVPPIRAEIREKWRGFSGDLHAVLRHIDPAAAERLKPGDRQRIIRALEVMQSTGCPLADWQRGQKDAAFLAGASVERHFMDVARDELYRRAERRFDRMMEQGALAEVRALPQLEARMPVMKAIGVPELMAHLRGETSLADAIATAKTATRHYIKRQLTWWRGQGAAWRAAATSHH